MNYIIREEDIACQYEREEYAEKAIKSLKEKGILPLSIDTPLFPEINILTGIIYFTGSLTHITQIELSLEAALKNNIEPLIENTGFELNPQETRKNSYNISGEGSLPLSKYFKALGVPDGDKCNQELHLPRYIRKFMKTPETYKTELTDFSAALLSAKTLISKTKYSYNIELNFSSTQDDYITEFVNEIRELLQINQIETTLEKPRIRKNVKTQRIYLGTTNTLKDKKELFGFNDRKYDLFENF